MLISKGEYSYYYLTVLHRSPSKNSEKFLSSVSQYFADIIPNSNFIICGDINTILITYS